MRIFFTISLLVLLLTSYFLYGWLYTSLIPIISLVYIIVEYLEIFKNSKTTNFKSLGQFLKEKFKNNKFIKNVVIIIWLLIVIMFLFNSLPYKNKIEPFAGIIYGESGEPLDSVVVFLQEFNKSDTTNSFGKFEFNIESNNEKTINIIAKKDGYHTYDSDGTLGNRSYNFILKKIR